MQHTIIVWMRSISPILKGWFIWIKINLKIKVNLYKVSCIISRSSLIKILILEINDKGISFFLKFKKNLFLFLIYKTNVFVKLLKLMIIFINWGLPFFLMIIGVFRFISNRKHLLSILLSLEYIVLSLFYILFIYLNIINYENYFRIVFLTFSVCEGVLGLSILVSIIRIYGNDYFQSFNILQC